MESYDVEVEMSTRAVALPKTILTFAVMSRGHLDLVRTKLRQAGFKVVKFGLTPPPPPRPAPLQVKRLDEYGGVYLDAGLCAHANEVPADCHCPNNCYCKSHTCVEP